MNGTTQQELPTEVVTRQALAVKELIYKEPQRKGRQQMLLGPLRSVQAGGIQMT